MKPFRGETRKKDVVKKSVFIKKNAGGRKAIM